MVNSRDAWEELCNGAPDIKIDNLDEKRAFYMDPEIIRITRIYGTSPLSILKLNTDNPRKIEKFRSKFKKEVKKMFGNTRLIEAHRNLKADFERLKLRLFGSGCTSCMNTCNDSNSDAILSEYRGRINNLEYTVRTLVNAVEKLQSKPKRKSKAKKKK